MSWRSSPESTESREELPQNDVDVDRAAGPSGNWSVRKPSKKSQQQRAACHRRWRAPPSLIHEAQQRLQPYTCTADDDPPTTHRQPDNLPDFLAAVPSSRLGNPRGFDASSYKAPDTDEETLVDSSKLAMFRSNTCADFYGGLPTRGTTIPIGKRNLCPSVARNDTLSASVAPAAGKNQLHRRFHRYLRTHRKYSVFFLPRLRIQTIYESSSVYPK